MRQHWPSPASQLCAASEEPMAIGARMGRWTALAWRRMWKYGFDSDDS